MARKYLTAGLLLVLTLSLTACGTSDKAGTSAHRWDGGTNAASQDWAIQRQADARGPLSGSTDGSYHAGSYDGKRGQAKTNRDKAGDDLKKAGENAKDTAKDLGKAAQDAARSIGDTAEDALDGMKQAAKNATDSAQKSTSAR